MRPDQHRLPDLRTVPLPDIISAIRSLPWSEWLFKQLDDAYQFHFLKARSEQDFVELRSHISFMLTYFLPQHQIEMRARMRHEHRWAILAELCESQVERFVTFASGSPEMAVLKCLASRESTEFSLLEPLDEAQRNAVGALIDKGLIDRVGLDRPHPLRPHDYTLALTDTGRDVLRRESL